EHSIPPRGEKTFTPLAGYSLGTAKSSIGPFPPIAGDGRSALDLPLPKTVGYGPDPVRCLVGRQGGRHMQTARPRWQWFALWVGASALLSSVSRVASARRLGATFDEPIYVTEGLNRWRSGSMAGLMKLGTMPLPVDVQTLPLYLWERWHGTPIDPVADVHSV